MLALLKNGILIRAKRANKFPKKVTAQNSGMSYSEMLSVIIKNPEYEMETLIKEIYKKKRTWQLVNNLYAVSQFTLLSDE